MIGHMYEVLRAPKADYVVSVPADVGRAYQNRASVAHPLRPVQASALLAMEASFAVGDGPWGPRGIVGLIGCGHGKTLIAQLAPTVYRAKRPMLVVPASLKKQVGAMISAWSADYRTHIALRTGAGVHSYEMLSSINSTHYLEKCNPDLLIFDEAHLLGNPESARWKRVARFLRGHPGCRVVCLSGTLTSKSIRQMAHLFHATIRDWSPFPSDHTFKHWSNVLDVGTDPSSDDYLYMSPLATHHGYHPDRDGIRYGLQALLARSRGVILSRGVSADVSLAIQHWEPEEPRSTDHDEAIIKLRKWELPDETFLVDALEYERHSKTLSIGYFGRFVPPVPEEWRVARKAWGSILYSLVKYGDFDSPGLVARAAENRQLDGNALDAWDAWCTVRHMEPPSEAVWVTGARARLQKYALDLVDGHTRVVWYESLAVQAALAEVMPVHGAGSDAPSGQSAAASRHVHGKGWNGQAYHQCVILEPPSNAGQWEQLLARHHRPGQTRDVSVVVRIETPDDNERWERARQGARYIDATTGEPQRLLYCDLSEL